MLKKNFLHWVACVIAVACWLNPGALFAQSGAAVLTGTVVDASNKQPVSDVVVTVTSPALQGEQTVVTDTSGFPDLDAAAVKVARATRYAAGTEGGSALPESCIKFKVKFVLKNN